MCLRCGIDSNQLRHPHRSRSPPPHPPSSPRRPIPIRVRPIPIHVRIRVRIRTSGRTPTISLDHLTCQSVCTAISGFFASVSVCVEVEHFLRFLAAT